MTVTLAGGGRPRAEPGEDETQTANSKSSNTRSRHAWPALIVRRPYRLGGHGGRFFATPPPPDLLLADLLLA